MRTYRLAAVPLCLAALVLATTTYAQAPRPGEPPPPPPGPVGERPPPPPPGRGASVHVDRGPDRGLRFDLHCAEGDTTRACADLALELIGKLNADVQAK